MNRDCNGRVNSDLSLFHVFLCYHGLPKHEIDTESLRMVLGPSLYERR